MFNDSLQPRFLNNGELIYPKRGIPPPVPEGYRRKSNNLSSPDAWIMIPIWRDCPFRSYKLQSHNDCKCVTMVYFCKHPENNNSNITALICENCKLWNY